MTGRAMNDDRGAGDPLPCKRMKCAACEYDTAEMYSGIDLHAPFRKIEIGALEIWQGSPNEGSLIVYACPRCGTLKI